MDLDTFLTTLYVLVDDWYSAQIAPHVQRRRGGKQRMSDSEVLTVALVGQWQVGVPWNSERGVVRYMQQQGRQWFPQMLGRSAFNERVRHLCTVLAALQQAMAEQLSDARNVYEVGDGLPLPVCSVSQATRQRGHWLGATVSRGHGGTQGGWFYGQRCWMSVTGSGAITGWLVGAGHVNERWLLEAFLSTRAGDGRLQSPPPDTHTPRALRARPPQGFIGGFFAAGHDGQRPYLADQGLNSLRWQQHWADCYGATVITLPPTGTAARDAWSRADRLWLAHHRQIIETVFAHLTTVFGIKHLNAHSLWGQYTRLAAKAAAFNVALWFNHCLGRSLLAIPTLLL